MRSRTIREGSAGLLILVGLALVGGLILWLRGFDPTRRSYRAIVDFSNVSGMDAGAPVRYRGVVVGKTTSVRANANVVEVELEIRPATLIIPKDVVIQVVQSGLVGETYIDIIPNTDVPESEISTNPLSSDCNSDLVICNGDRLVGESGVSFTELIGSITRFTDLFSNPEIVAEIRTLTRNSADAAAGIAQLTGEVTNLSQSVRQELGRLTDTTTSSIASVGLAADNVALTVDEVKNLLAENRTSLIGTLDNINQTTLEIQQVVSRLSPVLTDGQLLQNLEDLSANAAEASSNLRNLTESIGSSENLLLLQQTLESARATFQNAEKITADLDELTGDPSFRQNLRDLIDGLNNLLSSTQQLQQQTQLAQMLDSVDASSVDPSIDPSIDRTAPPTSAPETSIDRPEDVPSPTSQPQPESSLPISADDTAQHSPAPSSEDNGDRLPSSTVTVDSLLLPPDASENNSEGD
ncbi:MAG: MCE family protein [Cyanobacteria bacterium CRU_2_1]|nr:MCE family protein [Cyanobacteria bacterium CRU_2_1]